MTQITITNGVNTVTMPRTRQVTDVGEVVASEKSMADGTIVRDIMGFRSGFEYTWDYVPDATIKQLVAMLRAGGFFTVNYFDVDGTDKTGLFSVSYPSFKLFTFKNGEPVWHDCTLRIISQGVVK